MKILVYKTSSGRQPYIKWLEDLDKPVRKRIESRIEELGKNPGLGTLLKATGIYELREHNGAGYRIYYGIDGDTAYLLDGGTKATQAKDIPAAVEKWNILKERLMQPQEERSR